MREPYLQFIHSTRNPGDLPQTSNLAETTHNSGAKGTLGMVLKLLQHFKGRYPLPASRCPRLLLRAAGSGRRLFTKCGNYSGTNP